MDNSDCTIKNKKHKKKHRTGRGESVKVNRMDEDETAVV